MKTNNLPAVALIGVWAFGAAWFTGSRSTRATEFQEQRTQLFRQRHGQKDK